MGRYLACTFVIALTACGPRPLDEPTSIVDEFNGDDQAFVTNWLVEGTGTATPNDGVLQIQETENGVGVVVWSRYVLPDSVDIAFDASFSENTCIGVFFFAAQHDFNGDIPSTTDERTGAYDEYIRGDIAAYSLSLHRYWPDGRNNPGSNLRRNPGFHLLAQAMPDPALDAGTAYSIQIEKRGPSIRVFVDGQLTHAAEDSGNMGPHHTEGHFGFRLRGDSSCIMTIDRFEAHQVTSTE